MNFDNKQKPFNSLIDRMKLEIQSCARAKEAENMGMEHETYKHLMSYEDRLTPFPEENKVTSNLVTKCQSTVYLTGEIKLGHVYFTATSDSAFVRGELGLVLSLFQGMTVEEFTNEETKKNYVNFCSDLSEYVKISINRSQGLEGIYERMVEIVNNERLIVSKSQSTH